MPCAKYQGCRGTPDHPAAWIPVSLCRPKALNSLNTEMVKLRLNGNASLGAELLCSATQTAAVNGVQTVVSAAMQHQFRPRTRPTHANRVLGLYEVFCPHQQTVLKKTVFISSVCDMPRHVCHRHLSNPPKPAVVPVAPPPRSPLHTSTTTNGRQQAVESGPYC